jgi:23S rRNA-/tRNA-specific pseudouridylate synthase
MEKINIINETTNYIVIDKPAGLLVEKSPYFPSVEQWVYDYLKANEPRKEPFVGIVHRLDRPVSGVLLIAKKKSYLKAFNEEFRLRQVKKTYQAWVEKKPKETSATLKHWLIIDQKAKQSYAFAKATKNAVEVSLSYSLLDIYSEKNILEIDLHTGKFHQIRAQLSAIDCPIVGDSKYGATLSFQKEAIALHACRLALKDPIANVNLVFECSKNWGL